MGVMILLPALLTATGAQPVAYHFEIVRSSGALCDSLDLDRRQGRTSVIRGIGSEARRFCCATIRVAPGQKLRIDLDNRLEACSEVQRREHRCFNHTNLHTHGLWVSPSGTATMC